MCLVFKCQRYLNVHDTWYSNKLILSLISETISITNYSSESDGTIFIIASHENNYVLKLLLKLLIDFLSWKYHMETI